MVAIHSRASPLFSMVLRAARKVADFDLHVRTVYMTTDAGAALITVSELAKLIDTDDKPVLLDVRWQVGLPGSSAGRPRSPRRRTRTRALPRRVGADGPRRRPHPGRGEPSHHRDRRR